LCQLGPGQFIITAFINGDQYCILYDTGASICFVRPGLTIQSSDPELPENVNNSGVNVRLGDNSVVASTNCSRLTFDVKGQTHAWDYHVMPLPVGLDIIIGMDYMGTYDVILLTASRKVLFGHNVLNYANVSVVNDTQCKYGPELVNITGQAEDPIPIPLNSLQDDPVRPPTVPNIASKSVSLDDDTTYFYSHDDDDDAIREKIKESVSNSTSDHIPETNTNSLPANGKGIDYCHMPSDVLRDLNVICARTDVSNNEKWKLYCKMMQSCANLTETQKKQYIEESKWAEDSPADTDSPELFSFLCSVKCSRPNSDDGRRLAVITRLKKRQHRLLVAKAIDEHVCISDAWNVEENPIDPCPENAEAWLQHQYPKDENGESIRHQIDKTIKSEEQYVKDLKSGKICELAAQAFQTQTKFNPPPWAERLKLHLKEQAGPAKSGPRIKCPVHLREALHKFHEDLYFRLFIEPAADSESYASVLIVRKPDKADGTPRGWRFVIDLRCRNATLKNIANQLPEASTLFEYLKDAKVISVFDVKDGYWCCPLDPESSDLVAFSSECGEWKWKCLPQGLSVAAQFYQAWLTRLYRKYSIVIGQTKILPVILEKRQNAVQNILNIAQKLHSVAKEPQLCILDETKSNQAPTAVEKAVVQARTQCLHIQCSDGNFGVKISTPNQIFKPGKTEQPIKLLSDHGKVVYADSKSYAAMEAAMPLTGSTEKWASEILCHSDSLITQHPTVYTHDNFMENGLDLKDLCSQNRNNLTPKDLGTWKADPFCAFYVDDAISRSINNIMEARLQLLTFLRISAVERIPLNEKCNLLCKYVRFLGMINGNGLVIPCPEKIKAIVLLTRPSEVVLLQGFLGSVNWFRRHIPGHAEIQAPLNALLKKGVDWCWNEDHEQSWLTLKRKLMAFPVLHTFDPKRKTVLFTDSSNAHVGGGLCQKLIEDDSLVAIAYYSRSLRGPELSYPIQHKEMLAIVACVAAFEHYLLCAHFIVRACTDHKSLTSSFHGLSKQACDRVTRWVQKVCCFNMDLFYMPGCDMHLPDLLSRCKDAPEDAWKRMDVIDSQDFEYAPLLAMEPAYLFSMSQHYENSEAAVADLESVSDTSDFYLPEPSLKQIWNPLERALMGIELVPATTTVFSEADYLMCPDFKSVYTALLDEVYKSQHEIDILVAQALELITVRYEKLKIDLPNKIERFQKRSANNVENYFLSGGLLYYTHPNHAVVLCVPNIYDAEGINHRKRVFDDMHSSEYSGHRGENTTVAVITKRFWWPNVTKEVREMCKACYECCTSKINRKKPQGLLQPIEIPLFPAQSYNTDIIGPLPKSKNGNHCALIVVDRFSKRVFLEAISKFMTAVQMADLFVDTICYKHGRGVPLSVLSDNDKLFSANFFKALFSRLGTKWNFSTARTQSTDGQAERYVAVVEEILRTCVNYSQDDWEEQLSAIMFVINNQEKCSLLNKTPIQVEMNINPIIPADLITDITTAKAVSKNTKDPDPKSAAQIRIQELTDQRVLISENIAYVQAQQKKYADKRRSIVNELIVPGAKAYLDIPKVQMVQFGLQPSKKLSAQVFGPFPIVKQLSPNSFELDLGISANTRTINTFHVKYLRPVTSTPYPTPGALKVLPVSGENEEAEWELDAVLDTRVIRKKNQYLVRYKGYKLLRDCEWRPESELQELAPELLAEFTDEINKPSAKP